MRIGSRDDDQFRAHELILTDEMNRFLTSVLLTRGCASERIDARGVSCSTYLTNAKLLVSLSPDFEGRTQS